MFVRIFTILAFASVIAFDPSTAFAQSTSGMAAMQRPTQDQVKAALAAANVDFRQKRKLKPMVDTYKSQIASAPNDQAKLSATQQLMDSMQTVLSPAQWTAFKESLKNQMQAAH